MTPFDFINAVSHTKKDLITESDNPEFAESLYAKQSWVINRGLSLFSDTILYANEMNRLHGLDGRPQFSFLLNSLRPRKRYEKWLKQEKIEEVDIVSEYFGYSKSKSKDIIKLLTDEQITIIKQRLQKGGPATRRE